MNDCQVIAYINDGRYSETLYNLLGIESEAKWKLRVFSIGLSLLLFFTTIGFNIRPPFYYHLILSYPVPTQSWIISLISTSLLFVCINSTILTEILKNNLERKLLVKAKTGMDEQKKNILFNNCINFACRMQHSCFYPLLVYC